ncbi:hypothetical protein BDR26DRAFT_933924 [Obelidium mucronatum]|nr:hypothetical protein BDR26DRAFT_933924 [Obelidium mucronatum]
MSERIGAVKTAGRGAVATTELSPELEKIETTGRAAWRREARLEHIARTSAEGQRQPAIIRRSATAQLLQRQQHFDQQSLDPVLAVGGGGDGWGVLTILMFYLMGFTADENNQLRLAMHVVCPVALLANILLLVSLLRQARHRKSIGTMQGILAVADIALSIDFALGNQIASNEPLCTVIGAVHQFFLYVGSSWSFLVSLYCFLSVTYSNRTADQYWTRYYLYGFGLPFLFTAILFVLQAGLGRGNVIGDATFVCWISAAYPEIRIGLWFPTLWLHFLLSLVMFARIFFIIRTTKGGIDEIANAAHISTVVPPPTQRTKSITTTDNNNNFKPSPQLPTRNSISTSSDESSGNPPKISHTRRRSSTIDPASMMAVERLQKSRNKLLVKSLIITVGFIISWIPATALRTLPFIPGSIVPFWLNVLVAAGLATAALWNPLAFFVSLIMDRE